MAKAERVSAEDFVKTWQKAKSVEAIVEILGGNAAAHRTRANNFRRKGIPMKRFQSAKRGAPLNVEALTALAKSLGGEGATDIKTSKKAKK